MERFDDLSNDKLMRINEMLAYKILPFSRATLYRMIAAGNFPKPRQLNQQIPVWKVSDIRAWINSK